MKCQLLTYVRSAFFSLCVTIVNTSSVLCSIGGNSYTVHNCKIKEEMERKRLFFRALGGV